MYNIIRYYFYNVDVDECGDDTDGCSQTCTNTEGSFTCGCNDGYVLNVDGTTCDGMYMLHVYYYVKCNVLLIVHKGSNSISSLQSFKHVQTFCNTLFICFGLDWCII